MKNMIMGGIYRDKLIKVDQYFCDVCDENMIPTNGLVKEYKLQRYRVGELVAYKEEGTNIINIGFSACHPIDLKEGYNKEHGREKALEVADKCYEKNFYVDKTGKVGVPHLIRIDVAFFVKRVIAYFSKNATEKIQLPLWAVELFDEYCC